ncbi:MAG: 30S ribosomal protein S12 methylthiotransferase RimO [bacterium]
MKSLPALMLNSSKLTKVYFVSLGCPKNLVDSEKIMGSLEKNACSITNSIKKSDIVIINTCGFIKPALRETENEIKRILKEDKRKKIYVYGCAVNRCRRLLTEKFPEVTDWFYLNEKNRLLNAILHQDIKSDTRLLSTYGYAYLKIADGCSNHCSYCTIPKIKGEFKSSKFEDLINEAQALAQLGIKELILIAQDTARYGFDLYKKSMIIPLIKELSKIKGIEWLRLLYAHPKSITDELLYEIRKNPKVCKYLDMPIQHINNRLLALMNRGITRQEITNIIKKSKDIALRTTLITGFPTETEDEFDELYDFLSKGYFDWFGVFKYIREKDTSAALLKPLSRKIVDNRFNKLINLQQHLIKNKNQRRLHKYYKTLVHCKKTYFIGHTEFAAPDIDGQVIIKNDNMKIGEFYRLKITKTKGVDLYA